MLCLLAIFFPLGAAAAMTLRTLRPFAWSWLLPLAGLPALALALTASIDEQHQATWLLLGAHFGLGEASRVFLFFTALLWTVAMGFARFQLADDPHRYRFGGLFLLCATGNIGLVVSQDLATFYFFFTVMALSAYTLVIHKRTEAARYAGLVYLVMTVLGEALLLAALFLAAGESRTLLFADVRAAVAASERRDIILLLAFFGFGVKAGVFPVHLWLPLAHPVAPVPASAVLSGAMIKAGVLGWMQLLPLGHANLPAWGTFCIALGFITAFYAVLVGLAQRDPKTVLAYSSVSQIGVMTVALGIGLTSATAWPTTVAVWALYAMNHGIAKGALFLGVGVAAVSHNSRWRQHFVLVGLAVAALAIAGGPWTGGALAKTALKDAAQLASPNSYVVVGHLLTAGSIATALLLTRFLLLMQASMREAKEHGHGSFAPLAGTWSLLVIAAGWTGFSVGYLGLQNLPGDNASAAFWASLWPVLIGAALMLAWFRWNASVPRGVAIPAGDLVVFADRFVRLAKQVWQHASLPGPAQWSINFVAVMERLFHLEARRGVMRRGEAWLLRWETAGLSFLVGSALLLWLLMRP